MKPSLFLGVAALAVGSLAGLSSALRAQDQAAPASSQPQQQAAAEPEGKLVCDGVLGNSGEQGDTLVRFALTTGHGLGVVYDKYGSLWDRGGDGRLNRYALDGRQLGTYPIPSGEDNADKITHLGDTLVLLLDRKIYTLPVDAPDGTHPVELGIAADAISFGTSGNQIAILQNVINGGTVSLLDLTTKALTPVFQGPIPPANPGDPAPAIRDIELLPDGSVVATWIEGKLMMEHLLKNGHQVTDNWPRPTPGDRIQFINGYWYGQFGHATIRRFNADLEAAPGVVLGGGSGSFIGHVDENDELDAGGRGLAPLNDKDTFAESGPFGDIFILHWNRDKQQFDIVRRIGAVPACKGIALNKQGAIWVDGGSWAWDDRPESPRQNGVPVAVMGQASMQPNDTFWAANTRGGVTIMNGNFTWHYSSSDPNTLPATGFPRNLQQASATYVDAEKRHVFLAMNSQGLAYDFQIFGGQPVAKLIGQVNFTMTPVLKDWTSLGTLDDGTLVAGADGVVAEFKPDGDNWTLDKRWNGWGKNGPDERFGAQIYLCVDGDHIWVSDTLRHRVLCFHSDGGDPIATFGVTDQAGNDLTHLNAPQVIIGRENRAVVFDSGNQRFIKLELKQ